jgi:BirA family biotin operon repressor/biotin-[acetyl-CoA-carboxylase] ligase
MQNHIRLMQCLSDGRFHSGEELARELGISRAAVWKRIKNLEGLLGMEFHAVRGRGYRLSNPVELLDSVEIRAALSDVAEQKLHSLRILPSVESTNTYLLQRAAEGAPAGSVCLAERQSGGRGRHGRPWVSPFGTNIYLSVLWRYRHPPHQLAGLSLAAGLAVLRAFRRLGFEGLSIKWPNDLLFENRKLAGLLLEMSGETTGASCVVAGVGVNTRMASGQGRDIDQPWIDLASIRGGAGMSRNHLTGTVLDELLRALADFEAQGLEPLLPEWKRFDAYLGSEVELISGDRRVRGVHRGIDVSGALLLQHSGQTRAYHAGELSLRPVATAGE